MTAPRNFLPAPAGNGQIAYEAGTSAAWLVRIPPESDRKKTLGIHCDPSKKSKLAVNPTEELGQIVGVAPVQR